MVWKKIKGKKVNVFQSPFEDEVIYVIQHREGKFLVLHEDAHDRVTGETGIYTISQLVETFSINVKDIE